MERGIQLLREGHQLSGFQQIAAQSYQFRCLREIEQQIYRLRLEMVNWATTGEMFQQVHEKAYMLKEELESQRYAVSGGVARAADVYYDRLGQLIRINELQTQIGLYREVSALCSLIASGIDTIARVRDVTSAHVSAIAEMYQSLRSDAPSARLELLAALRQLGSIREAVTSLLRLENESALTLLNSNVAYAAQLITLSRAAAESIELQVLEPAVQIWSQIVRQRLQSIGHQFLGSADQACVRAAWYNADNAENIARMIDFGDKRVNQHLLDIIAQYVSEPADTDVMCTVDLAFQTLHELIRLAEQLGFRAQLLDRLQSKWKSFFIRISLDKISVTPLYEQEEYIIGYFTVLHQFKTVFAQQFIMETQKLAIDNIDAINMQMKQQIGVYDIYRLNVSDTDTLHHIIGDLYGFRRFVTALAKLGVAPRAGHVEAQISKIWIQLFTHHLNAYFGARFEAEYAVVFSDNVLDIKYEQSLNAEAHYSAICVAQQQFQIRIFMLFVSYIDYIYIWLGKGPLIQPPLEILLTLYGKYPKQLNTQTFYEILESFNEFFIVCVMQFFEAKFAYTRYYAEVIKLFSMFSALLPAIKAVALYVEHSTYFNASNIFNEILEILKEKASQYFIKYVSEAFLQALQLIMRWGSISDSLLKEPASSIGIFSDTTLAAVYSFCQFHIDILNNYNVYQFQQQLYSVCKCALIRAATFLKKNSVDREALYKLNALVCSFKQMFIKYNLIQIDEYTSFRPIFIKGYEKTLALINKYYGIYSKEKQIGLSRKLTSLNLHDVEFTEDDIKILCHWKCGQSIRQYQEKLVVRFSTQYDAECSAFDVALKAFEIESTPIAEQPNNSPFFYVLKPSGQYRKAVLRLQQLE